ncbi:MAG: metal ABC transporter permease [Endomicrobiia bacterium]
MTEVFLRIFLVSILSGIICGIVSVWVVLLNIPFITVVMSHSAFLGSIFGLLAGINPVLSSVIFCLIFSILIGPIAEKGNVSLNISTSIIFSFVLGLSFVLAGLIKGPKSEVLNFLFGNILSVDWTSFFVLGITLVVMVLFTILFYKEIFAVLFNREIAKSVGIYEKFIFYSLIFLCSIIIAVNLNYIGGILIFSLVTLPGLTSYQFVYNLKTMYFLSIIFAVISSICGLILSYFLSLPTGATIIVVSNLIYFLSLIISPKK